MIEVKVLTKVKNKVLIEEKKAHDEAKEFARKNIKRGMKGMAKDNPKTTTSKPC